MRRSVKNKSAKKKSSGAKLFVYGTLRNQFGHKLNGLIKSNFELIGKGMLKGKLFDIGRYPGAVFPKSSEGKIVGEIYQVKDNGDFEAALAILDKYEGYEKDNLKKSEYIRQRKYVQLSNGRKVLSWVYVYNKPVMDKRIIAGGDYIRHLGGKSGS